MLNISKNSIENKIRLNQFLSYRQLSLGRLRKWPLYLFVIGLAIIILFLFLPWTQNVKAKGEVTTLQPAQRPQAIQSVISGQLKKWYVNEGDFVQQGDTIIHITEVKPEYFDPNLIERTQEQVNAKEQSVEGYAGKVASLNQQYESIRQARDLKLREIRNKIQQARYKYSADSTDLVALKIQQEIAQRQLERTSELYDKGLKSLTEFEQKRSKAQELNAKVNALQNNLLASANQIDNLELSLSTTRSEYSEKLAKARSDRFSALTSQLNAEGEASKLKNQLSNYSERQQFYYVTAPQSGYVTKAIEKGVGEIIKEGTDIVSIMPDQHNLAVELYVRPIDLPLLEKGQTVRLLFDGWPAIAFSGWPDINTGSFEGEIFAIDQLISSNGKYRVLVAQKEEEEKQWPEQLRVGAGSQSYILLNNVPIWYELWRQLNGFPPDFYQKNQQQDDIKLKPPIKSVK